MATAAVVGLLSGQASGQPLDEGGGDEDRFYLSARSRTNVQMFQRALLPGPGGAIVTTETLAPIHESLSVIATGIDTPLARDSVDMEVAVWGRFTPGSVEGFRTAAWDVSSAFVRQRYGNVSFTLGRQTVTGGAARYRRMDGALVSGKTDFGLSLSAYAGLTALPRWDQWYGYHYLGDAYERWAQFPDALVRPERSDNFMAGGRILWRDDDLGSLGVSFHHQQENEQLGNQLTRGQNLGANFGLTYFEDVVLGGEAIFSTLDYRFSDLNLFGNWKVFEHEPSDVALSLRGEVLHTVPSLLMSQASVLSVFSHGELTEAGGEVSAELPLSMGVSAGAFAQMYNEGDPGSRTRLEYRFQPYDDLLLRLAGGRVQTIDNGYWMLRAAARYGFHEDWSVAGDFYQYRYDESIEEVSSSSFYSTHLVYQPRRDWSARVGGSLARSPYARLDAQVLARFVYEWNQPPGRSL